MIHASMTYFVKHKTKSANTLNKNAFYAKSTVSTCLFLTLMTPSCVTWANVKTPGEENLSLLTPYHPEYEPQGLRVNDFIFSPSISTGTEYNDNVYATKVAQMHDYFFKIKPALNVRSDFVRHEISASISAERGLYHDLTGENYTDYSSMISGRLDITGNTSLPITASYDKLHERRGSPDDRAAAEPTKYDLAQTTLGIINQGQTLALKALAGLKRYIYKNGVGASGTIDNGDRNHDEYSLYTSIGAAEEAVFSPYLYSNVKQISYDRKVDNSGFGRNSMEYETGVGTLIHISDITRASFNVGYLNRNMDDATFSDISTFTYGLNLLWKPSTLASFLLEGKRSIEETTIAGSAATVNSSVKLSMNYELFPNIILTPSVSFLEQDYQEINKTIEGLTSGLGMTYKLNPNIWLTGSYQYTNQNESGSFGNSDEYNSNTYNLSLNLQF